LQLIHHNLVVVAVVRLVIALLAVMVELLVKLTPQVMDKRKQAALAAVAVVDVVAPTVAVLVVVDQMFMAHFHHIAIALELVAV
jgi:hypothetical protein